MLEEAKKCEKAKKTAKKVEESKFSNPNQFNIS
jgi:hypothetical protein